MNRQILHGDVLEKLAEIESESINVIISSPPYWGLRDYGVEGQLGLEKDFHDYLDTMSKIMDELKRVLRKDGTCWINLGDTYSTQQGSGKYSSKSILANRQQTAQSIKKPKIPLQEKSRIGIPQRFYINCIDDGWIARNDVVWYKSNSMPSSVKDRFTNKWEPVFFFAKNQKYYFDLDAVREKTITESKPFNVRVREKLRGHTQSKLGLSISDDEKEKYNKDGTLKKTTSQICKELGYDPEEECGTCGRTMKRHISRKRGVTSHESYPTLTRCSGSPRSKYDRKQDKVLGADGKPKANYAGFNDRYKEQQKRKLANIPQPNNQQTISLNHSGLYDVDTGECLNHPNGKNPGDFFKDIDYTDEELLEWIKLCRENQKALDLAPTDIFFINPQPFPEAHFATFPVELPKRILRCACPKDGIVLDPFFGSGTTGVAAEELGLRWVGIELSEEYIEIANRRLVKYKNKSLVSFT